MEFGIIPALAYLGSNIDINNDNEDIDNKYHEVNFVYGNDRSDAINKIIESKKNFISRSHDVENTNIFNNVGIFIGILVKKNQCPPPAVNGRQ